MLDDVNAPPADRNAWLRPALVLLLVALFAVSLFRHISYPLLWNDESFTAMFGQRVVEYGYPKVHGERNLVYGLRQDQAMGVDPATDAYLGSPWGQYYFAAIGVALAESADDPYAATARLRLPFALAGASGIAILLAALLPSVQGRRARYELAIGYLALVLCSTSLVLHLREVRYYSLAILLSASIVYVFAHRQVYQDWGAVRYAAALVALLVLLCNTFYALFGVFIAVLGLHAVVRALRSPRSFQARKYRLLWDTLPLGLALLASLPTVAFLNLFTVTAAFMTMYEGAAENRYASVLSTVFLHLLRYEFLGPALLSRLAVSLLGRKQQASEELRRRRVLASFLFGFAVVHALLVAALRSSTNATTLRSVRC